MNLGFRKMSVLTRDRDTQRPAAEAHPRETPPGSKPPHQVMAATVACPAEIDRAARVAVPCESQLACAPALERGAEGLISPEHFVGSSGRPHACPSPT